MSKQTDNDSTNDSVQVENQVVDQRAERMESVHSKSDKPFPINNVINLSQRVYDPKASDRMRAFKLKFDHEQAKIAVSTSLMSILVLVTLLNQNFGAGLSSVHQPDQQVPSRGIASVSTGTSDAEDRLVSEIARRKISEPAAVGRKPSLLEKLAFESLEGKYAVRFQAGKLEEIRLSRSVAIDQSPKQVLNRSAFLEEQRRLLPDDFHKSVRIQRLEEDGIVNETYQLVDRVSRPVGIVQFRLDQADGMLGMRVQRVTTTN